MSTSTVNHQDSIIDTLQQETVINFLATPPNHLQLVHCIFLSISAREAEFKIPACVQRDRLLERKTKNKIDFCRKGGTTCKRFSLITVKESRVTGF